MSHLRKKSEIKIPRTKNQESRIKNQIPIKSFLWNLVLGSWNFPGKLPLLANLQVAISALWTTDYGLFQKDSKMNSGSERRSLCTDRLEPAVVANETIGRTIMSLGSALLSGFIGDAILRVVEDDTDCFRGHPLVGFML